MSTTTKTNRKVYDPEFQKQAVQLLHTSGRPLAQIARELGVEPWQLRAWKKRLQPELARQPETLEAMRLRVSQLERENLQLRHQRDILKKTLGIVSTT
jgi:transposase